MATFATAGVTTLVCLAAALFWQWWCGLVLLPFLLVSLIEAVKAVRIPKSGRARKQAVWPWLAGTLIGMATAGLSLVVQAGLWARRTAGRLLAV